MRIFQEILQDIFADMKTQATAFLVAQEFSEAFIVKRFEDANSCAINANRVTLKKDDLKLAQKIQRNPFEIPRGMWWWV